MEAMSSWAQSERFLLSLAMERRAELCSTEEQTWEPESVNNSILQDFNTIDLKTTTFQKPLPEYD